MRPVFRLKMLENPCEWFSHLIWCQSCARYSSRAMTFETTATRPSASSWKALCDYRSHTPGLDRLVELLTQNASTGHLAGSPCGSLTLRHKERVFGDQ